MALGLRTCFARLCIRLLCDRFCSYIRNSCNSSRSEIVRYWFEKRHRFPHERSKTASPRAEGWTETLFLVRASSSPVQTTRDSYFCTRRNSRPKQFFFPSLSSLKRLLLSWPARHAITVSARNPEGVIPVVDIAASAVGESPAMWLAPHVSFCSARGEMRLSAISSGVLRLDYY